MFDVLVPEKSETVNMFTFLSIKNEFCKQNKNSNILPIVKMSKPYLKKNCGDISKNVKPFIDDNSK